MKPVKHTPVPWESGYIFQASTYEIKENGKRIALVLQYDDRQNRVADFETCEARAKLMAAARELLEALKEAHKELRLLNVKLSADQKQKSPTARVIEAAEAAIKKATI